MRSAEVPRITNPDHLVNGPAKAGDDHRGYERNHVRDWLQHDRSRLAGLVEQPDRQYVADSHDVRSYFAGEVRLVLDNQCRGIVRKSTYTAGNFDLLQLRVSHGNR